MEKRTSKRGLRCLALMAAITALTACDAASEIKLRSDGKGGGGLLKTAGGAEFVAGAQPMTQTPQGFYVESSAGSYVSKSFVTTPRGYKVYHGVQSTD